MRPQMTRPDRDDRRRQADLRHLSLPRILDDRDGHGVIPYVLIAGVIALGILGATSVLRDQNIGTMNRISAALNGAADNSTTSPPKKSAFTPDGGTLSYTPDFGILIHGNAYSFVPMTGVAGGGYTISLGSLPFGFVLDPASGKIAGSPTQDGAYSFSVQVAAAGQQATFSASGTVLARGTLAYQGVPSFVVGQSFSVPATTNLPAGQTSFSITSRLPSWMAIDGSSGTLSGTPTTPGPFEATITAAAADGRNASAEVSGTVLQVASLAYSLPAAMVVGTAFEVAPSTNLTQATFNAIGAPSWMTLDPTTGHLTGTPTAEGAFGPVGISASSTAANDPRSASTQVSGSVLAQPSLAYSGTSNLVAGQPVSITPTTNLPPGTVYSAN